MKITISNQQKDLKIPTASLKKKLAAFLEHKKVLCSEVSIYFVTKKKICELHEEFFNDPTPTDCISQPLDDPDDDSPFSNLGEVFVCPKVACEYAETHESDPQEETLLYAVHGLLHLLGFDDLKPEDRKVMRAEERKALAFIRSLD